MRTPLFLTSAALLAASLLPAQTPARPAAPARIDPDSPANHGRKQLDDYVDTISAQYTAARRATIANIKTRAQAEARQRETRAKILSLIGGLPEKTPLNAKVLGTTQADGFRIEKVLYESQPNFPVTALFYLPDNKAGQKLPAIVIAPGHGPTGKASDYSTASTFARNGFAVLSWDPVGQGERLQYPDPADPTKSLAMRPTGEHGEAGLQPTLLGDAVSRYFIWDAMRAVDYLESRPEVDPNRIGAFGCSGGGTITALFSSLDTRIKTIASACFITSFDKLLPSIGPQDAEQSVPNFISSGFDFPDWVELAAPRPYAVISTASDMFPYAGALTSVTETRRFYSLFDPASAGTPTGNPQPGIPTGPTLNPDTSNNIPATAALQWITGIGGHGNLRPLQSQIVSFFLLHLAHSNAQPIVPPPPPPGASPFALPADLPKDALQVTPTGQIATSYPTAETIHSLNLKRARQLLAAHPVPALTPAELQHQVREITHASAQPGATHPPASNQTLSSESGIDLPILVATPTTPGRHPAVLLLTSQLPSATTSEIQQLTAAGNVVLALTPRPSPPGNEETKAGILGPFYLTELRAELNGKTLLGMRVDDTIRAIDVLAGRPDVDPTRITAQASGHMGLVLLHAAVLDARLRQVHIDHSLESYKSLLEAPMPIDAPEDILPGVVRHYDIPDLLKALGTRATFTNPLPGTANLANRGTSE